MKFFRKFLKRMIVSFIVENKMIERFFRYQLVDKNVLFFRDLGDHSFFYYPHDVIGIMLTETGEYSRDPVHAISEYFRRSEKSLDNTWILDLGGNIGTHTVYLCREFESVSVLAVEPDPQNVDILKRNIDINNLSDRATVVAAAVSNFDGKIDLVRDFYNRGGTSVHGDIAQHRASAFLSQAMTVDSLLKKQEVDPSKVSLAWIDVEGHELEVLEGMEILIANSGPSIFFEYTPGESSRDDQIMELIFGNYGNVFEYHGGFQQITRDDFQRISEQVDIFATNV